MKNCGSRDGSWEIEDGRWTEIKTEIRGRKSEIGDQWAEVRNWEKQKFRKQKFTN
jgi:hypothetical protein